MSIPNFLVFYPSAFAASQWHWEKPGHKTGLTLDKRVISTLTDLSRQIVPFIGATVATNIFMNPKDRSRFVLLGIVCVTGHIGGRVLSHLCHYKHEDGLLFPKQAKLLMHAEHVVFMLSQACMAVFYVATLSRVIHELGRSIAALMLFQSPTPVIKIGFWSSSTEFIPKHLTPLGEKIGWARSKSIMQVAGSIAVLLHDLSLVHYAYDNNDPVKDPMLSTQAYMRVFFSSLRVIVPLVPFFQGELEKGLDKNLGFHPVVEAIGFLIAPILYGSSLFASDSVYKRLGTIHLKPDDNSKK